MNDNNCFSPLTTHEYIASPTASDDVRPLPLELDSAVEAPHETLSEQAPRSHLDLALSAPTVSCESPVIAGLLPVTNEIVNENTSYRQHFEGESPSSHRKRLARERKRKSRLSRSEAQKEDKKRFDMMWRRRKRASESAEEKLTRIKKDAKFHQEARNAETLCKRSDRLLKDGQRHVQVRINESLEECQMRRSGDSASHSLLTETEVLEERNKRLLEDNSYHFLLKEFETWKEKEIRLSRDAFQYSLQREFFRNEKKENVFPMMQSVTLQTERENPEERQKRLLANAKRHSAKRREVTADEKQFRNDMEAQRKRQKRQEAALREKSGEMGEERVPFWRQWATRDEFASAHYPRLDTFHKRMEGLTFHTCVSCEESWPTLDIKYSTHLNVQAVHN